MNYAKIIEDIKAGELDMKKWKIVMDNDDGFFQRTHVEDTDNAIGVTATKGLERGSGPESLLSKEENSTIAGLDSFSRSDSANGRQQRGHKTG